MAATIKKGWFGLLLSLSLLFVGGMQTAKGDYAAFVQGMIGSSVVVNQVQFSPETYSADAATLETWFNWYFSTNYLTDALRANLGYPVFSWGANQVNLQLAFWHSATNQLSIFLQQYPTGAGAASVISNSPALKSHVFNLVDLLGEIAVATNLGATERNAIKSNLATLGYPIFEGSLIYSAAQVNLLALSPQIYRLDATTASNYFRTYLASNRMTTALRVNLTYPFYSWGANHTNLQTGYARAAVLALDDFFSQYASPENFNSAFSSSLALHEHVLELQKSLFDIAQSAEASSGFKQEIFDALKLIVIKARTEESGYGHVNTSTYPFINPVKTQFRLTLFGFADAVNALPSLVGAIYLPGKLGEIFNTNQVLVAENLDFDDPQLTVIAQFLENIPPNRKIKICITCVDFLRGANPAVSGINFYGKAINIFGNKVGLNPDNPFPADYQAVLTDGFAEVLAHEYGHVIDGNCVVPDAQLSPFRQAVLESAGANHTNYLRSMLPDDFFQSYPQEFFASIANEYFTSSKDTFRLALQKARQGNMNQMNQFCLFASTLADAQYAWFYRIQTNGATAVTKQAITRANELLSSIVVDGILYSFNYAGGLVVSFNTNNVVGVKISGSGATSLNLQANGVMGSTFVIERSQNLSSWQPFSTNAGLSESQSIPLPSNFGPQQFFRIRIP
jgi:hypothetical protein